MGLGGVWWWWGHGGGPGGGEAGRVGPGGPGRVVGQVGLGGGPGGWLVGWYRSVAENVHTARKDVCNGGVKNTLLLGQNGGGREKWGECREK